MRTPNLIDVPKMAPTRKERLHAFMAKHTIEAHAMPGPSHDDEPKWCALHMPTARQYGYGVKPDSSMFDCVAKVGRLLDESGVMGYGHTEAEAVKACCAAVGIQFK